MKVIIPCAGYATRLYPLTENMPKALLDVNGKPILEYVLERVGELEQVDEIFIVTNNKFFPNFMKWKIESKMIRKIRDKVKIVNDNTNSNSDRLGTIGDTWMVMDKEKIDEDLLIVLGDNLFDFDLKEAYDKFDSLLDSLIVVYDVKEKEEATKMGIVTVDSKNKVSEFFEKPKNPKSTLASIGIYFVKQEHLKHIKEYFDDESLSNDRMGDLIAYLVNKKIVGATSLKGRWFDIGSKETYKQANETW